MASTAPTPRPSGPDGAAPHGADSPQVEQVEVERVDVERVDVLDVPPADPVVVLDAPADRSVGARLGAEALGTFGLVLVVLGAALYLPLTGVGTLGTALAAGLVVAGLTAALGHVSGGHFNPAVTLGAALAGRVGLVDLVGYWLAQLVGGVVAAAVVFVTVPAGLPPLLGSADTQAFLDTTANGFGEHSPLSTLSQGQVTFDLRAALILEAVATAVLVAVIVGVASRRAARSAAPLAVGLTYAALLVVTGPVTGGGLNPARSTAAAVFAGPDALGQLWLFWVAPLLGAALVGLFALAFAPSRRDAVADDEYPGADTEDGYDELDDAELADDDLADDDLADERADDDLTERGTSGPGEPTR